MKCSDIPDHHVIDLAAKWLRDHHNLGVLDALVAEGVPGKLAERKIERLVDRGLLEYGCSIRYAWPVKPPESQAHAAPQNALHRPIKPHEKLHDSGVRLP